MITDIDWNRARLEEEVIALRRRVAELEAECAACQMHDVQFRQIFENAATGIALVDMTGRVLRANQALQRMLGRPETELCTMSFVQLTHPDDVGKDWALFQEMVAGQRDSYQIEKRYVRRDGILIWGRLTVSMLRETGREATCVLSIVEDITQRKAAEELLRRERALGLALSTTDSLGAAYEHILMTVREIDHIDGVGIYVVDPVSGDLELAAHAGLSAEFVTSARYFAADTPQARLAQRGRPVYRPFAELGVTMGEACAREALKGIAIVPVSSDGRIVAVLGAASRTLTILPRHTRRAVEAVAAQAGGAIVRLRAAEAVQRERQNWQGLFDAIDDLLFVLDERGCILLANRAVRERLGYTAEELAGQSVLMVHPPDRHAEAAQIMAAMLAGRIDICEMPVQTRDGRLIPVDTRGAPGFWNDQPVLFGVTRDVSERRQMELNERAQRELAEALRDTAAALNSTLDISEVFDRILANVGRVVAHDSANIMLIDADQATARLARIHGYVRDAAAEYVAATGLPVEELANLRRMRETGRPILVPDTELDPDWVQLVRSAEEQQTRSYVGAPIKIKQQVVGFINLNSLQPYFFTRSHALGLQVFADQAAIAIENARLFEAQQRQLTEQTALLNAAHALASTLELDSILAVLAGRLGEALDVTSVYICAWHSDSGQAEVLAQWANAQANESERQPCVGDVYNLTKDFGDDLDQWLFPGRPFISQVDDPALYEPARQHMLTFGGQSALTVPLVVKGRSIGYVDLWESRRKRLFQPDEIALTQGIAQQAAMAMDNAQLYARVRRHAEELEQRVAERTRELTEANAQLAELDRLKDDFLSRISHELRTPLAAVKIYIDLLEHGKPEKQARYREIIRENTDKLQRLIEDLLRISDLDPGHLPADIQPINLNQVARDQITAHSTAARLRELTLTTDLAEALPLAQADARLLAQAVSNLVVNALNYTPGRGTVTLRTGQCDEDDRWLTLTVADTGPGISPEDLPRIFDRFYRGHAAGDYTRPGVGVGLSVSRTLIERLGGHITVENVPGAGAAFTVWLRPVDAAGEVA